MRYLKPHYYDTFQCIADQCPDTCCAGWQIMIDDDSLERYGAEGGEFGRRLRNSIDWKEGCFYQCDRRCSFLNKENLCDIYTELGAEALCDTCRIYPRHTEEYEGLRELSLSLSCPMAAEIILSCTDQVRFEEEETEEEDDFDDFDFLMFSQLEDTREVLFQIIQNRRVDLRARMLMAEHLAHDFQRCLEEDKVFEIDNLLSEYKEKNRQLEQTALILDIGYEERLKQLAFLKRLERLRPEWTKVLEQAEDILYSSGKTHYEGICADFQCAYGYHSDRRAEWENIGEQLMMFFVYTYFCGSVYDDMVYTKMAMAVFCTTWIQELSMLRWVLNGRKLAFSDIVETAYRFAREIEHSDNNLNALEEYLWDEKQDL